LEDQISLRDVIIADKKLFKDKNYVKSDFPLTSIKSILHRNEEIEKYYKYLVDFFHGIAPDNIFIYGIPGIGKTILTELILKEVEEEAKKENLELTVVHINCGNNSKEHGILQRIVAQLPAPKGERKRKLGNSVDNHYDYIEELVNKYIGIIIIVLDEFDKAVNPSMINNIIRMKSKLSLQYDNFIEMNDLKKKLSLFSFFHIMST